jgi:hypothetical protein
MTADIHQFPTTPNAEAIAQATQFKRVESLCGVWRLAMAEALEVTAQMTEGEMKVEAAKTLTETLLGSVEAFKAFGEPTT